MSISFYMTVFVEVSNAVDKKIFLSVLTTGPAARAFNIRITQVIKLKFDCLVLYFDEIVFTHCIAFC